VVVGWSVQQGTTPVLPPCSPIKGNWREGVTSRWVTKEKEEQKEEVEEEERI